MGKNRLTKKKLKIITPMVLSMILLVAFVGYWLHNQYYHEKRILQKELTEFYHETIQDAEFILYYQKILKPILNSNDTPQLTLFKNTTPQADAALKKEYATAMKQFVHSNERHFQNLFHVIDNKGMIPDSLRGDRYFEIYRVGYKYQVDPLTHIVSKNPTDSAYQFFQKLFIRGLDEEFSGLEYKKEEEYKKQTSGAFEYFSDEMLTRGRLGILVYRYRLGKAITILFDNYFFYLISIIIPQIIFGIVLISLSVFALVFVYRSYLTQARLNMLRADFMSNITHELKIPVATAKAAMEAILNYGITDDKEKTKSYLTMVALEMNRLDRLTTRVLEHSRLEASLHLLHKEPTDLNDFIDRIVDSVQMIYPDLVKIKYRKPAERITIPIDQVYTEGVIRNLIENSKKYGGNGVILTIRLWQEGQHVFISVIDNGPGIPEEYLKKVFDRFFRVPTGNHHNVKGFGLGLSFAALVMQQHDGSIKARNLPGQGCELLLKFPN